MNIKCNLTKDVFLEHDQIADTKKPANARAGLIDESKELIYTISQCEAVGALTDNQILAKIGINNQTYIAPNDCAVGSRDISNNLVIVARNENGTPTNLLFIDQQLQPHQWHKREKVGFYGCNLDTAKEVYLTIDILAFNKLMNCGVPVVLVPPHTKQPTLKNSSQSIIDHVQRLNKRFSNIYMPVPLHELKAYSGALIGQAVKLLPLPFGITVDQPIDELKIILSDEVCKLNTATTTLWGELQPLEATISSKGNPYPIDALPPTARAAVEAIAEYVQSPIAMSAQCVIAALSHIAQQRVNAPHRHNEQGEPCSLFVLTEGQSGSRKSESQRLAYKAINDLERTNYDHFRHELENWQSEQSSMSRKERSESSTPPPTDPSTVFNDATIEPVIVRFINKHIKAASWSTDEASQFFNGHTMKGDTAGSALGAFTRLFDAGTVERTRSSGNADGSGKAFDVRLTFNLQGQHEVLVQALNDPILRGQGFLPRFLFAAPENLAGTRLQDADFHKNKSYLDIRLLQYWQRCNELLPTCKDGAPNVIDSDTAAGYAVLELSPSAHVVWNDFYNHTERLQAKGSRYEYLQAFASRAAQIAMRVATVFSFFELKPVIDESTMTNACRIVQHSLDEWTRYADVESKTESDAQKLIKKIGAYIEKNKTKSMPYITIHNNYSKRLGLNAQGLALVIEQLEAANYLKVIMLDNKRYVHVNPEYTP